MTPPMIPTMPGDTLRAAQDMLRSFRAELRLALLIRATEQRLLDLYTQGKLFGTVHTCIGQEFSAVAVGRALQDHDIVFSNHRGHGHFLATGGTVDALIAEVAGKGTGQCAGRGGSQHLHRGRYYSNGIQGGILPVAAGLAMAQKLLGTEAIGVVFLGDGTLGEGAVYETMNIASKWELPLLMVCENNGYAQSTDQRQTLSGDLCSRAEAFGIAHSSGNTYEWPSLFGLAQSAVQRVRETSRPLFLRVDTFRLMAHSKGDDNRDPELVRGHWALDPLSRLEEDLDGDATWSSLREEVAHVVATASHAAEDAAFACVRVPPGPPRERKWNDITFDSEIVVKSVYRGLAAALANDARVLMLGEDIEAPYGGAFKCTRNLSELFPGRVRNTPISELAITGIGNGLALGGFRPVVEIMFGDFVTLMMDQWINHAAKFRSMFNDAVSVPIVIRTPMGGKRGYGATHSQSLERHLVGVPGTQVLCLHHRYPPANLYEHLFATIDCPTLVIENKLLYGQEAHSVVPPGFALTGTDDTFPTVRLGPIGTADITVIAIGGISLDAESAMMRAYLEDELLVEVLMPTKIYPLDTESLAEHTRKTRRLVVVEEGQGFASVGAEIVATLAERPGFRFDAVERVSATPDAIPAARPLEAECLPGVDHILDAIRRAAR